MKHQQVNVDYWAMGKAMLMYGALTAMCWIMLRLFNMVFTLPGRMRAQQDQIQNSLQELQRRYPDLNITEEDLKEAERELEAITKEEEEEEKEKTKNELNSSVVTDTQKIEDKKSI